MALASGQLPTTFVFGASHKPHPLYKRVALGHLETAVGFFQGGKAERLHGTAGLALVPLHED